jgi:Ca2+-binding RTX toxin-like protein
MPVLPSPGTSRAGMGRRRQPQSGEMTTMILIGTYGKDVLKGTDLNDLIYGLGGDDTLYGKNGQDMLFGGANNDVLIGGESADHLDGGDGEDTASYRDATAGVQASLGLGEGIWGEAKGDTFISIENLEGSEFRDMFWGDDKANKLYGRGGDDFLSAEGGNDQVFGGDGDDFIRGGAGADHLDGGKDKDGADYTDSPTGVWVDLSVGKGAYGSAEGDTLVNIEDLYGSDFDDILAGDTGSNYIRGGKGDDLLKGGGGDDHLVGDQDNDTLIGGAGADFLVGGDGIDRADYGTSNAGVVVSLKNHAGQGGHAQGDTLYGIENVAGSTFADALEGDGEANVLNGVAGDDVLKGGGGADTLIGGLGRDTMAGGVGADKFVWSGIKETGHTEATADVIVDFNFAEGDRIDLGGIDANVYAAGNQAFTFIGTAAFTLNAATPDASDVVPGEIRYYHAGGNTYIELQTGTSADVEGVICLQGILTPQASWFIL